MSIKFKLWCHLEVGTQSPTDRRVEEYLTLLYVPYPIDTQKILGDITKHLLFQLATSELPKMVAIHYELAMLVDDVEFRKKEVRTLCAISALMNKWHEEAFADDKCSKDIT